MGWQDAPIADGEPAWASAPVLKSTAKKPARKPKEPSAIEQFGSATVNTLAGLAQGAAGLPDALIKGVDAVSQLGGYAVAKGGDTLLRSMGADKFVDRVHQGRVLLGGNADGSPVYRAGIGDLIERFAPTPSNRVAKGVRIASQFTGGMMNVPGMTTLPKVMGIAPARVPARPPSVKSSMAGREIIDEGKRAGVRVLTSDVRPPKTFVGKTAQVTGERVIGMGTGGVRQAQQAERVSAVKSLLKDFGADDVAHTLTDDVAADLAKTRGAELTKFTNAKNMVIDKFSDAVVQTPAVLRAIDDQVVKLKGINQSAYAPVIAKLDEFKQVLQSGKSLRQIEGNRKLLGDLFKDPSLAAIRGDGEKALNAIYAPLRDDMGNFIREKGGQADFTRWKTANEKLAAMAGELDSAAFKRALNNVDVTPENVANVLFNKNPSEVARLYANLSPQGQSKAQAAILHRAMEKAGGMEALSPDKFANEIERLGKNVGIVFKGNDLDRVNGLTKLLNATQRAATASVSAPTGVQNFMTGLYGGAGILGGIKGLVAVQGYGALARAYESVAVRNALLKLGQASAGSVQERALMRNIDKLIVTAASTQGGKAASALNDNLIRSGSAAASPDQGPNE